MRIITSSISLILLIIASNAFAQKDEEELRFEISGSDTIYFTPEEMPAFPGGSEKLYQFLSENIVAPPPARVNNVSGKVYATFIIDKDGSVNDIKILRGIGSGCDEEVVRVLKLMPKWNPGFHEGKPVKVKYTLPVAFPSNTEEQKSKK